MITLRILMPIIGTIAIYNGSWIIGIITALIFLFDIFTDKYNHIK